MRVMVMMKGTDAIESGVQPSEALIRDMTVFNGELAAAGLLLAGEGLQPSSKGKRVIFGGNGEPPVVDGPFAQTRELIAGFWIWKVKDMDEAVAWARRIPDTDRLHGEVEIRPILDMEDFEALTPELQAREAALREATGHYSEA
ncbi:YciI family protein [Brevundimonas naejangsanensis]|uniref:YciI family protein n=1 Tax=Brevundimonas naejangsanensis TaxID=588932 RepID=A0A494RM64_9CAUL|nr:YciI family protein [Brevundimonas naejangsanensis]AYG95810.1 YciI family protein [Brevundimonas naejangsanensis]